MKIFERVGVVRRSVPGQQLYQKVGQWTEQLLLQSPTCLQKCQQQSSTSQGQDLAAHSLEDMLMVVAVPVIRPVTLFVRPVAERAAGPVAVPRPGVQLAAGVAEITAAAGWDTGPAGIPAVGPAGRPPPQFSCSLSFVDVPPDLGDRYNPP